jgi:hypothetical protein
LRIVVPFIVAVVIMVAGGASVHAADAAAGGLTLTAHDLTRYLHVVLLVFWLGPEVAIMIAGNHAVSPALNAAQRAGAARMMEYYDIMPRVCMSLMLTVGGVLSEYVGLAHPWWQMAGIWLLGPLWLALTLGAYFGGSAGAGALAERLEQWLRLAVIVTVPISVGYSTATGRLAEAPYVGSKLLLFAIIVLLSLLARRAYRPFRDGVRELAAGNASPALDETMRASFVSGRRFVFGIWAALLLAALVGIIQPGVPDT